MRILPQRQCSALHWSPWWHLHYEASNEGGVSSSPEHCCHHCSIPGGSMPCQQPPRFQHFFCLHHCCNGLLWCCIRCWRYFLKSSRAYMQIISATQNYTDAYLLSSGSSNATEFLTSYADHWSDLLYSDGFGSSDMFLHSELVQFILVVI